MIQIELCVWHKLFKSTLEVIDQPSCLSIFRYVEWESKTSSFVSRSKQSRWYKFICIKMGTLYTKWSTTVVHKKESARSNTWPSWALWGAPGSFVNIIPFSPLTAYGSSYPLAIWSISVSCGDAFHALNGRQMYSLRECSLQRFYVFKGLKEIRKTGHFWDALEWT